jgi:hypothetical protein
MGNSGDSTEHLATAVAREAVAERSFRIRMLAQLRFADFLAVMMVFSTAFSAYATWRTAKIADSIYMAAERAYFGIQSITFNNSRAGNPRVAIDYRNLGNVTAMHLRMLRRMSIDGAEIPSATKIIQPGVLSPGVPHLTYIHLPVGAYAPILAGRSSLRIQVVVAYTNPRQQPLCYMTTFTYDADEQNFDGSGGSLDCSAQQGLWPPNLK